MQITINDEVHEIEEAVTLQQLLEQLCLQPRGMAVAVNQQVIAREGWQGYQLKENDAVFVIRATHGG